MDSQRVNRRLEADSHRLLSAEAAAERLGIAVSTLYDWLSKSDHGELVLRGQPVAVDYLQGGARGQGKINIEVAEVERLKNLLRVPVSRPPLRRTASQGPVLKHIQGPLGRPDES